MKGEHDVGPWVVVIKRRSRGRLPSFAQYAGSESLAPGTEAAACSGCMCGANCTASPALHRGSMAARAAGSERSGAALTCHVLECHALACLYGWVGGRNLTQRNEVMMGKHSIMDAQERNHAGGR